MWDIRLAKPVKEYHGNVNETKLIPFSMDSCQSIIASGTYTDRTLVSSLSSIILYSKKYEVIIL